ncbi:MAG: 30S ribosomal protein S7 [Flavobacteriales bacterium]|jgi:small subunit ribosomal protein S7|nr:30S ribosomal protein S7 [Flavobacteriales bacterium]MBT4477802.1 30S ribosomal protein S7 [Flavobacteriales bacterium]MBT5354143.1 30S ribosomal protein S7 [Flavobacteriales bacterium]MBT6815501.1 30S ribosomal protein S7 [Flavobacteriales bacterium]MBT7619915.1 30S ribosomal protein S7 [Flavobacteriales bacterium]|tara:strand:+ start:180 stop:650 length:471 start_codon:yes stop_codon:yes gene_type:complete
MRKSRAKKRILIPDPKFGSILVTRFVNNLMLDGKKSIAFKVFYDALDIVSSKVEEEEALLVWEKSLENITPHVEVRSRRIGGATFQIPQPVRDDRRTSLGMKWLIDAARKRNEKTMANNLSSEIVAGYKEEGAAYKKKQDTHRMAEANKAFSHFRF